jgi:hypothetical protein
MPSLLVLQRPKLMATACLLLLGIAFVGWRCQWQSATAQEGKAPGRAQSKPGKNYSPYADRRYATQVFWGDQHQHTSFSPDAGLVGDRLSPDDAFRFARGEQLRSSTGQLVQLERPLDWLVVSDHSEYLGLPQAFLEGADPDILKTPSGKKWAEALKKGPKTGYEAFVEMTKEFADGKAKHSRRGPGQAGADYLGPRH